MERDLNPVLELPVLFPILALTWPVPTAQIIIPEVEETMAFVNFFQGIGLIFKLFRENSKQFALGTNFSDGSDAPTNGDDEAGYVDLTEEGVDKAFGVYTEIAVEDGDAGEGSKPERVGESETRSGGNFCACCAKLFQ